jgi:cell division septation protein DedD
VDEETGDETIGDVLSRVGKLNKPDMTTEAEAYGLQVDPEWTKDEIMEEFEKFLVAQAEAAEEPEPEVTDVDPDPVDEQDVTIDGVPPVETLPSEVSDEPTPPPATELIPPPGPPASGVRITQSRAWGRNPGAYAP